MNRHNAQSADTSDREIVLTRIFDAPRGLVFKVWTEPSHATHWWGPDGFSVTNLETDVRPGGVWRYIMHGPDGHDYPNRIVFLEIVTPARIVYDHRGDDEGEPVIFRTIVTFEDQGGKTKLTMCSIFPTAKELDRVVKEYGAIEGGRQMLERLAVYLDNV